MLGKVVLTSFMALYDACLIVSLPFFFLFYEMGDAIRMYTKCGRGSEIDRQTDRERVKERHRERESLSASIYVCPYVCVYSNTYIHTKIDRKTMQAMYETKTKTSTHNEVTAWGHQITSDSGSMELESNNRIFQTLSEKWNVLDARQIIPGTLFLLPPFRSLINLHSLANSVFRV